VEKAIALLSSWNLGESEAQAGRKIVATAALSVADRLDDSAFDFLLGQLKLVQASDLARAAGNVGRSIIRRRPERFARMLEVDEPGIEITRQGLQSASVDELTQGIAEAPTIAGPALRARPELAQQAAFWSRGTGAETELLIVLRNAKDQLPLLRAMIEGGRLDMADRVASEVGRLAVLRALATSLRTNSPDSSDLRRWLQAIARPEAVAQLFASDTGLPQRLLDMIARVIEPDAVPNEYGEDPWWTAVRMADGDVSGVEANHLRAYLLARSLGWRSRNPAELAQYGFEATYFAAANSCISEQSWHWLDRRLPTPWFEWDRCRRLRAGVVDLFVERELAPEIFGNLVHARSLLDDLVDYAARTSRGRSYLKLVRAAVRD
jgi:hypothetical protein